jgi:GDPmannose 4,6-dehydratase
MKTALITGIGGQDGSYLAEFLVERGIKVFGTLRRNSTPEHQESRIHHLESIVTTYYADLNDISSMSRLISKLKPDFIFNLAAQSHVRISFEIPNYTSQVNAVGALNLFDVVREVSPQSRLYQASSSEMFGTAVDDDGFQRETTPMLPASPYGCSKLFAYHAGRTFRDSYGLHISNGILFNHESPRRGSNFVTSKIVKEALRIYSGVANSISLGNLDSFRDWGHSRDYVRAMFEIISNDEPLDLVIATGETRSVRNLCETVFSKLGMNYLDYLTIDPKLFRPKEVPMLRGDSGQARKILNWKPEISFEAMIEEMLTFWAQKLNIEIR